MNSNHPYKITRFTLKEKDFWDLMFFFPRSSNEKDRFQFEDRWCGEKISTVVELIFEMNQNLHYSRVGDMLWNIIPEEEKRDGYWFMELVKISRTFEYETIPKILVRNFLQNELDKNPHCSFRIEDGNRRAVVFGLWLRINEYKYIDYPMIVVHSNSFHCAYDADRMKNVLGFDGKKGSWPPYESSKLEDSGVLGAGFYDIDKANIFEASDSNVACDKIVEFFQSCYGQ